MNPPNIYNEAVAAMPPPGARAAEAPDFRRSVDRFVDDQDGQSMVEFVVVLPVFLFLVMGIVQFMMITNAAYMLNYGNFMAMRTAVANWEMSTVGRKDIQPGGGGAAAALPSNVRSEAKKTLQYCLLPVAYFKGDKITSLIFLNLAAPKMELGREGNANLNQNWLESFSEYRYPLMIPLANSIIYAITKGARGSTTYYADALTTDPRREVLGIKLPNIDPYLIAFDRKTILLKTSSNVAGTGANIKEFPHRMIIQRRW